RRRAPRGSGFMHRRGSGVLPAAQFSILVEEPDWLALSSCIAWDNFFWPLATWSSSSGFLLCKTITSLAVPAPTPAVWASFFRVGFWLGGFLDGCSLRDNCPAKTFDAFSRPLCKPSN